MKWLAIMLLAAYVLIMAGAAEDNEARISRLEALSGQNCARIDTLEAFYAE